MKTICYLMAIALSLNLIGCGKIDLRSGLDGFSVSDFKSVAFDNSNGALSEVAPPNVIQKLSENLARYQPKVTILSPRSEVTLQDTKVEVKLAVDNLAIFKDDRLGMGNHLHLMLDNEPYGEIYSLDEPIFLTDLKPGTHSLRVLAEKPWHESFKNPEAYAGLNFSVLTATEANHLDRDTPLLTYNQPNGVYTTEPILLDFYLSDVDRDNWQVEAKINDEVFIIDEWQPIYLTGFVPGNNLIELELQDSEGTRIENSFNKTIRLIAYQEETGKQKEKTLALLMRNRIAFEDAMGIVKPNYDFQSADEPESKEIIEQDLPAISETIEEIEAEDTVESSIEESEIIPEKIEIVKESETEVVPAEIELDAESTKETIEVIEDEVIEEESVFSEKTDSEIAEILSEETPSAAEVKTEVVFKDDNIPLPTIPKQDGASTTSVKQKTSLMAKDRQLLLKEEVAEMPVEEEIVPEEKTKLEIITEEPESDNITVTISKPKLKVPEWWQKFVINFQQIKEQIFNYVNDIFSSY